VAAASAEIMKYTANQHRDEVRLLKAASDLRAAVPA